MKRNHLIFVVLGLTFLIIIVRFSYKQTIDNIETVDDIKKAEKLPKYIDAAPDEFSSWEITGVSQNSIKKSIDDSNDTQGMHSHEYTESTVNRESNAFFEDVQSPHPSSVNDGLIIAPTSNDKILDDYILPAPENVNILEVFQNSITVCWNKVDNADGYNIYYCEDRSTYISDCKSIDAETNKVTLTGLNAEAKYEIDVIAFLFDGNQSDSSEKITAETLMKDSGVIKIPKLKKINDGRYNSACYSDCVNAYAKSESIGDHFDFERCIQRCLGFIDYLW